MTIGLIMVEPRYVEEELINNRFPNFSNRLICCKNGIVFLGPKKLWMEYWASQDSVSHQERCLGTGFGRLWLSVHMSGRQTIYESKYVLLARGLSEMYCLEEADWLYTNSPHEVADPMVRSAITGSYLWTSDLSVLLFDGIWRC